MTKEERAEKAHEHHKTMNAIYSDEYFENFLYLGDYDILWDGMTERNHEIQIEITKNDTVTEVIDNYRTPRLMVLNFASFTTPGGGFIKGDKAQEEDLCMCSNLYESLSLEHEYYDDNRKHTNFGAYSNRAIVSRDIMFTKCGLLKRCDVLSCAAPNLSMKPFGELSWDNDSVLMNRIMFLLNVAESEHNTTLILGAWGCGAFRQNPYEVALAFKHALLNKYFSFKKIIFAIPEGFNHTAFKTVFNDC